MRLFDLEEEYSDFIKNVNSIQDLRKERDSIINFIKNSEDYKIENNNKFCLENNSIVNSVRKGDIYNSDYVGKTYFTIDLKNANFVGLKQMMKNYELLKDIKSYKQLLEKLECKYIKDNWKMSRQFIFGNLNPKRISKHQLEILERLIHFVGIKIEDIVSINSDEIILKYNNFSSNMIGKVEDFERQLSKELNIEDKIFQIDTFTLYYIDKLKCYLKKYDSSSKFNIKDFKCLNSLFTSLVQRQLKRQYIQESDLIFNHEGIKCKMIDYPIFTIEEIYALF